MPKVSSSEAPEKLRPYLFHKVPLQWRGTTNAIGECPFCGGEGKFSVDQAEGLWRCFVCGGPSGSGGGNAYSFLRQLHINSLQTTDEKALEEVSEERRIPVATLKEWGLVQSAIDREWLLPAYGPKREINNLYRWSSGPKGKRVLRCTATMDHCLFGMQFWDDNKPSVLITEGPWDGMALRRALMLYRLTKGGLVRTGDIAKSIYATYNVVSVPGCEVFKEDWVKWFTNKDVALCFDSDYPKRDKDGKIRIVRGKPMIPGYLGMESTAVRLKLAARSITVFNWGVEGFDPRLPDGFDTRDYLTTDEILKAKDAPTTAALPQ